MEGLPLLLPNDKGLGDKGYQGAANLLTPKKKTSLRALTPEETEANRLIGIARVTVERIIGRLKSFRCLSTPWRSSIYSHPKWFKVLANIVNLSLDIHPLIQEPHEIFKMMNTARVQSVLNDRFGLMAIEQNGEDEDGGDDGSDTVDIDGDTVDMDDDG